MLTVNTSPLKYQYQVQYQVQVQHPVFAYGKYVPVLDLHLVLVQWTINMNINSVLRMHPDVPGIYLVYMLQRPTLINAARCLILGHY